MNRTLNDDRRFSFLKASSRAWLDDDVYEDDPYGYDWNGETLYDFADHDEADYHDGWSAIRPRRAPLVERVVSRR